MRPSGPADVGLELNRRDGMGWGCRSIAALDSSVEREAAGRGTGRGRREAEAHCAGPSLACELLPSAQEVQLCIHAPT
jgi:hypothetical protein